MTVYMLVFFVMATGATVARLAHRGRWDASRWPARAHLWVGWTLVVLGLVHVGATWVFHPELSTRALWFASGGIAMSLGGALNLLQRLYGGLAPGISIACVGGNAALTVLTALFVVLAGARVGRDPQFAALLFLLLTGTVLSVGAAPLADLRSRGDRVRR